MTKQEFATLVVAMQAMYGKDFIGTEQALDVCYMIWTIRFYPRYSNNIC